MVRVMRAHIVLSLKSAGSSSQFATINTHSKWTLLFPILFTPRRGTHFGYPWCIWCCSNALHQDVLYKFTHFRSVSHCTVPPFSLLFSLLLLFLLRLLLSFLLLPLRLHSLFLTVQGWTNHTLAVHERVDSRFSVLSGSESTITEITEYIYFGPLKARREFKYKSE